MVSLSQPFRNCTATFGSAWGKPQCVACPPCGTNADEFLGYRSGKRTVAKTLSCGLESRRAQDLAPFEHRAHTLERQRKFALSPKSLLCLARLNRHSINSVRSDPATLAPRTHIRQFTLIGSTAHVRTRFTSRADPSASRNVQKNTRSSFSTDCTVQEIGAYESRRSRRNYTGGYTCSNHRIPSPSTFTVRCSFLSDADVCRPLLRRVSNHATRRGWSTYMSCSSLAPSIHINLAT